MTAAEIDTVVFDLGGVLIDVDHQRAFDWLVKHGCVVSSSEEFVQRSGMTEHERGELAAEAFLGRVNSMLSEPQPVEALHAWWTGLFSARPGMIELARSLRQHKRIFILSNTGPLHWAQAVKQFELKELSDDALTSFEAGVAKPDARIYQFAASRFHLRPTQTVFIDDLEINAGGAAQAGWHAIVHQDERQTRHQLSELGVNC